MALGCVVFGTWFGVAPADAHPAYLTAAEITVEADGSFHGQARFDTLAFALNDTSARIGNEPMESLLSGPREELTTQLTEAGERFRRGFRIVTDAGDATLERLDFPDAETVLAWRDQTHPVLPVVIPVWLSGHLPPRARTVAVRFPPVLEQVILTVQRPGEEPDAQPVAAGAISAALPMQLAVKPPSGSEERVGDLRKGSPKTASQTSRLFVSVTTLAALSLLGVFGWKRR